MNHGIEAAFDSIESAHEFVGLLTETTVEGERDTVEKALLDYCGQDTLAPVRILERLKSAQAAPSRVVSF